LLERCNVCPRDCFKQQIERQDRRMYVGRLPSFLLHRHFGEEPRWWNARRGKHLFWELQLRCVYCQNYQIRKRTRKQIKNQITHERLAEMMLELQARGCQKHQFCFRPHISRRGWPGHFDCRRKGLRLPIVTTRTTYDSVEVLKLLDGIGDVYLPDFDEICW